jgi:hypothetical protein
MAGDSNFKVRRGLFQRQPGRFLHVRKAQNDISFRSPKQEFTSFDGAGD